MVTPGEQLENILDVYKHEIMRDITPLLQAKIEQLANEAGIIVSDVSFNTYSIKSIGQINKTILDNIHISWHFKSED